MVAVVLTSCKTEKWADWRLENELWLENNKSRVDSVTPTGLQYKIIAQPSTMDRKPDDLKTVAVTYTGSLITGNVFDSQSSPTTMDVSSVIKGFAEGLKKMTPGSHFVFYIPYDLGYGTEGNGTNLGQGYIPPYSTLIFDVTLHDVY